MYVNVFVTVASSIMSDSKLLSERVNTVSLFLPLKMQTYQTVGPNSKSKYF